ncbi:MAG TPA: hypothetical protein VK841_15085 [Polyangiaceae bacterium]|jgi:hypothetical protein|nr:hypothetical protein [Polyangiaceae bacterium]
MTPLTIFESTVPPSSRREPLRAVPPHREHARSPRFVTCASLGNPEVAWTAGCASASHGTAARPRLCAERAPLVLDQLDFHFFISRDGEFVRLELTGDGVTIDLGGRVHHRALATLAERRLADRAMGLPETSCGWVYADDLHREAGNESLLVNLHVFRARKLLASKGIAGAAAIVERRTSTHEIRIGTGRLAIVTL